MKIQSTKSGAAINETWSVDRIKELTMSKINNSAVVVDRHAPRRITRKFTPVAAAIVLSLSLATIALAASGVVNFGEIFNSIFRNEEATPYVQVDKGITVLHNEGEVSVEPLAAFIVPADGADGGLFMELRIRDLKGTGVLSDSLVFLWDNGYISDLELNTGEVQVSVIDENTVVAGLFISPHSVGRNVRIDKIVSGDTILTGNWEFTISSDNALKQRKLYGTFEGNRTEVTLNGTGIEFWVYADYTSKEFPYSSFPFDITAVDAVIVQLIDGTLVYPSFNSDMVDSTVATFSYRTIFIDPVSIESVTFCGTTIGG